MRVGLELVRATATTAFRALRNITDLDLLKAECDMFDEIAGFGLDLDRRDAGVEELDREVLERFGAARSSSLERTASGRCGRSSWSG